MQRLHSLMYQLAVIASLLVALMLNTETCSAQAQNFRTQKANPLIVNPKRVVFEGQQRNDMVVLINNGTDTATYQVSMIQSEMDTNGATVQIDSAHLDPHGMYADKLIRFFPKKVTLGPGQSQTIRLQLLKPSDLPIGEYRSHLLFRSIPRPKEISRIVPDSLKAMYFNISTSMAVAIPIIVRNGTKPAVASLGELKVHYDSATKAPMLGGKLFRSGNQSLYGMIIAKFVNKKGEETIIGVIKGVAVLMPNAHRNISLPLLLPDGVSLSNGKLVVEYQTYSPEATKESVLASAELSLN